MGKKDFTVIYVNHYNKYLEKYIKEVEGLYKLSKKEGDAENFAYNSCCSVLTKKKEGLKIFSHPYDRIYSKLNVRGSLVQDNNINRLYVKHIIPVCEEFKIDLKTDIFDRLLEEFAIIEASRRVSSWFRNWSSVYGMMFELNDFSEFNIIRNSSFSENSEIFKKYHKKIYPYSYLLEEKVELNEEEIKTPKIELEINDSSYFNNNEYHIMVENDIYDNEKFELKEKYLSEDVLKNIYNVLKLNHLKDNTSFDHFYEVFTRPWDSHKSEIYFSCTTQEISYLISELQFLGKGKGFSFAKVGRSKKFISNEKNPISGNLISSSKKVFNPVNNFLNLNSNHIDMKRNVDNVIKKIKLI